MTKDYAKNRSKLTQKRYNRYKTNLQGSTGLPSWAWMVLGLIFGVALSSFIFWKCNHSKNKTMLPPVEHKTIETVKPNIIKPKAIKNTKYMQSSEVDKKKKEKHTVNMSDLKDLRALDAYKKQNIPAESRFDFYTLLPTINVDTVHTESAQTTKNNALPYILQAGSFKTQEQADELKAILALQGLEARIQTVTINAAESWYRVYIGPFPTKADALNVQQSLENGSQISPNRNLNSVILKMRV